MRTFFKHLLCLVSLAVFARAEEAKIPPALHIEVWVYSGLADPRFWITDPKLVEEILSLVKDCPQNESFKGPAVGGHGGGYRGFRLRNRTTFYPEIAEFIVYRSDIEIRRNSSKPEPDQEFRKDDAARLEKKLIQLLDERKIVPAEVMDWIKKGRPAGWKPEDR